MWIPTLYVCHQVEQSRRQDERREAGLWRLLRQGRPRRRLQRSLCKRRPRETRRIGGLLGDLGL
jgi:hypothetical protein